MTNHERRRAPRIAVDVLVQLAVEGTVIPGRLRDISPDAVLVDAGKSWPLGTAVDVTLELPEESGDLTVSGQVVRLAPGENDTHGMAVLFTDLPPAAATRIDLFVARHQHDGQAG